ncbi:MAG: DUF3696 domain-containing protein [Gammaproteobacteria bacterium]|nr:DUF3696 domain-containing protein [Gammaproteobacteria bacterium]
MLKKMTISNFKAWREAEIEFGKITGFFGANSTGKSSILQFLLMLKQTKNATDQGLVLDFGGPSGLVNLGTFGDVVHKHEQKNRLSWNLAWKLPRELKIDVQKGTPNELSINNGHLETWCEMGWSRDRLKCYRMGYKIGDVKYRLESQNGSGNTKYNLDTDNPNFNFIRNKGRAWPLGSPIKTHLFPDEIMWLYQNAGFLNEFEKAYEDLIDSIYYLGPLREHPKREYQWAGSSPIDVGQRGERTIDAILAARRDGEQRNFGHKTWKRDFEWMIAYWLKELGLIHHFHLDEIAKGSNLYHAMVQTSRSSPPTALTDVGFGVSQLLPALVLLYYVPRGSTVLIEQPEIHLHPAAQSGLAGVMYSVVKSRNLQILVESHSEHLLRGLQRHVAEEKLPSDDVKLFFISQNKGQATASDLSLNQWGEIEIWPHNFFGDEMGELAAIAEASLKRKLEQSK